LTECWTFNDQHADPDASHWKITWRPVGKPPRRGWIVRNVDMATRQCLENGGFLEDGPCYPESEIDGAIATCNRGDTVHWSDQESGK
jgi:hypothetical protein